MPTMGRIDRLSWKHDSSGKFNVKSFSTMAYKECYEANLPQSVVDFIWQGLSPPKAELLLWFLVKNKFKTGELLQSIGILIDD